MYNVYRRALLRKITNKDKASSATSPVLQIPLKIPPQKILQIAKLRCRGVLDCKFARKFLMKLNLYHVYIYPPNLNILKIAKLICDSVLSCVAKSHWKFLFNLNLYHVYISSKSQNPPIRKAVILLYLCHKLLRGGFWTP